MLNFILNLNKISIFYYIKYNTTIVYKMLFLGLSKILILTYSRVGKIILWCHIYTLFTKWKGRRSNLLYLICLISVLSTIKKTVVARIRKSLCNTDEIVLNYFYDLTVYSLIYDTEYILPTYITKWVNSLYQTYSFIRI